MSAVPSQAISPRDVPVTATLAERARTLGFEDLPQDIRRLTRQCLLDWLAVTLAGAPEPLTRILAEEIGEQGGKPEASVIGHPFKTSMLQAALLNGSASHALDYDDVNIAFTGHPSVAVIPALLALAEVRGASGKDFMTAFVAGYETICRAGSLVAPGHYNLGFHSTGTVGTFGAAAACARLLGLNRQQTAYALGIAGTQAAGLKSMFGTMCKPLHAGKACYNGLLAARLAARGFTSREDVLECPQGFAATHGPDYAPETALADPAGGFHLRNNLFKYHAACYGTHAAIECARRLRQERRLDPAQIRQVVVRVDPESDKVCNIQNPRTGLEAKFSLRLTVAFALLGIDTAGLDSYSEVNAGDPAVIQMRDKIRVELAVGRGFAITDAEMRVELADGSCFEARHDSGVPAADLRQQGEVLEAKFHSLAGPLLGAERAQRIAGLVAKLEELPNLSELVGLCVPA